MLTIVRGRYDFRSRQSVSKPRCRKTNARDRLRFTGIRLHGLRHTHAPIMLKRNVPVKVVSERLGHSSPAFTMTVYQHVMPGMQADAARLFAAAIDDTENLYSNPN